mmetsp:Transcript_35098/g.83267  ORF Transcript_35098/g.83267 Transcript_35098/m.83267 type:complete len:227 (+) Transcript_35098:1463-2143(+)
MLLQHWEAVERGRRLPRHRGRQVRRPAAAPPGRAVGRELPRRGALRQPHPRPRAHHLRSRWRRRDRRRGRIPRSGGEHRHGGGPCPLPAPAGGRSPASPPGRSLGGGAAAAVQARRRVPAHVREGGARGSQPLPSGSAMRPPPPPAVPLCNRGRSNGASPPARDSAPGTADCGGLAIAGQRGQPVAPRVRAGGGMASPPPLPLLSRRSSGLEVLAAPEWLVGKIVR